MTIPLSNTFKYLCGENLTAVTFSDESSQQKTLKKHPKDGKLARNDQDYDCPQKAGQDNP